MSRIVLLGGMLAAVLLCAGAATLAFEISSLKKHERSAPADAAMLTTHLKNLRDEIASP